VECDIALQCLLIVDFSMTEKKIRKRRYVHHKVQRRKVRFIKRTDMACRASMTCFVCPPYNDREYKIAYKVIFYIDATEKMLYFATRCEKRKSKNDAFYILHTYVYYPLRGCIFYTQNQIFTKIS